MQSINYKWQIYMTDNIWLAIREETEIDVRNEPMLASFLHASILKHDSLEAALSYHLANQLGCAEMPAILIREVIDEALLESPCITQCVRCDLTAVFERDSACHRLSTPFLYFKGFLALQSYRIAHWLWNNNRESLSIFFQHKISMVFGVDIHPAATLGYGIMIDHATGLVIGQTTVVGNNVSIMQSVTLGGTGKEDGDRHPKVGNGVLISAGAKILGNINIGDGAKIGAGSVVLQDVPDHTTAAGVPAKLIGKPQTQSPALEMNHEINCDRSCS